MLCATAILCISFLLVVQMYTLQELCLDCTGANACCFQICDFEGICWLNINTQLHTYDIVRDSIDLRITFVVIKK